MLDSFETRFAHAAAEVLRACAARDEAFFVRDNPVLKGLHRLHMRLEQKGLVDWALLNLDAWGAERVVTSGWGFSVENVPHFLAGVAEREAHDPAGAERLLTEHWPLLWHNLVRTYKGYPNKADSDYSINAALRAVLLRPADSSHPRIAATRLDMEGGPFALEYHDRLFDWGCKQDAEKDSRGYSTQLTPLQLAWATQNSALAEVLLRNGATIDSEYAQSGWSFWSLRKAMDFSDDSLSTCAHGRIFMGDPTKVYRIVRESYQKNPEAQQKMVWAMRAAHLEFSLPEAQPAVFKPRF